MKGLWRQPSRAGLRRLPRIAPLAVAIALAALLPFASAARGAVSEWTTYHHDGSRGGVDPDSSSPVPPARTWQAGPLDGNVYAEPLVLGSRVYVATENDTIYALDAASGAVVWHQHLATAVPSGELPCGTIDPTVGITSTPVIDPATNTIYAVVDRWDGTNRSSISHQLFALDLSTGAPRPHFPLPVDPPYPAGGAARNQLQRTGLALAGGRVIIGYGGNNGDCETYWGWLVSAAESGEGAPLHYQVDSKPGHLQGAIWGSGNAPAVDASGHVYAATGNGSSGSEFDFSESVLKLTPTLGLLEWWAPEDWSELDTGDTDLGSSDPVLLPGGLLFEIGKQGLGLLLAANALGSKVGAAPVAALSVCGGSWGGAIFVPASATSGTLYVTCDDGLHAVTVSGLGGAEPKLINVAGWKVNGNAVGPPIFAGGLVWVASYTTGTLSGLSPSNGEVKFEEPLGTFMHFATPSAGGGELFVANDTRVTALRIAATPSSSNSGPPSGSPTPGARPAIFGARQSHRRWREGPALARISSKQETPPASAPRARRRAARARRHHGRLAPVGTEFSLRLNEPATVRFAFLRALPGRRVGKRCLALRGHKRTQHTPRAHCTRTLTAATLTFTGHAGHNAVRFQGRVSRSKRLPTGHYTLVITATNASGSAPVQRLRFAIVGG
jgi:outer membrane protein assembly factor BamB